MNILPENLNTNINTNNILPTTDMKTNIIPYDVGKNSNSIINSNNSELKDIGTGLIVIAVIMLFFIFCGYFVSYNDFRDEFESEWSRSEGNNGTYYSVELDINDGVIEYKFNSWLLKSTIDTFSYSVIALGKVKINDRIINVNIDDDIMTLSPAITSTDNEETWVK